LTKVFANLVVVTLAILAQPAGRLFAQTTQASAKANSAGLVESLHKNSIDLQRASFAPPTGDERQGELKRAVEQVNDIDMSASAIGRAGKGQDSTNKNAPQTMPTSQESTSQSQPAAARKTISTETLELLKKNPPGDIKELLAIADALFSNDELAESAVFYDLALQQSPTGDEKGWVLFQLANCRRYSDPAGARAMFKKLADEVPNCPWANLAGAVDRVIEWEMTEKPQALLNRPTSQASSAPWATTRPATMSVAKKAD
jgi:hypothetical protein